ncbi:hypothetical protein ACIBUR_29670 [Streptomyces anulatus]
MPSDSHQLRVYARALGLTYEQLLDWYADEHGEQAPHSGAVAWARSLMNCADDPDLAQREFRASVADSESLTWQPLAFRLGPGAHAALMARTDTDRKALPSTVRRSFLSPGHYLDAALRSAHGQPLDQLATTQDPLPSGGGALFLVGTDAHEMAKTLTTQLTAETKHAVISGLTTRFLNRLGPQPPW